MAAAAAAARQGETVGGGDTDKISMTAARHGQRRPLPCVLRRIHTML